MLSLIAPTLVLLKYLVAVALSLWIGYLLLNNPKTVKHIRVALNPQGKCLADYRNVKQTASSAVECEDIELPDTISSRSRYTSFCVFLFLQPSANTSKSKSSALKARIICKWQVSESDYRALTAYIAQSNTLSVRKTN